MQSASLMLILLDFRNNKKGGCHQTFSLFSLFMIAFRILRTVKLKNNQRFNLNEFSILVTSSSNSLFTVNCF